MLLVEPGERQGRLSVLMPWVATMSVQHGQAAAYVCRNYVCEAPVTRPEDLR